MTWIAIPRGYGYTCCVVRLRCGHHRILFTEQRVVLHERMNYCLACHAWSSIISAWTPE